MLYNRSVIYTCVFYGHIVYLLLPTIVAFIMPTQMLNNCRIQLLDVAITFYFVNRKHANR